MIVHNEYEQGSGIWMTARAGLATASEFCNIVTQDFSLRKGAMLHSYLARKVAEHWSGGPLMGFSSFATEAGQILEEEALPWLSLELDTEIKRVGFITTDDGKIGCSPDGLIGDNVGCEIKCPLPQTQVGYLLDGVLPPDYKAQVYGSMLVTGFESWKFLSYNRRLPKLLLTIERDEEIMEKLSEALEVFLQMKDAAIAKLTELNGGPPKQKLVAPTRTTPEPSSPVGWMV